MNIHHTNISRKMPVRTFGRTGLKISAISFGAGPISTLMVGDEALKQREVIEQALRCGVNWFDTAATYGQGQSEANLGRVLEELGALQQVQVATKVRLSQEDLADIPNAVRRSCIESLRRLRLKRVTLLQLHNAITNRRGDEPTSITPDDVLGPNGVAEAMERLRAEGLVSHLGLTGIGQPSALAKVASSGRFAAIQVPYHLLNPSAGQVMPAGYTETNYGNIISVCAQQGMGVSAIRVLAGGALAGNSPSPHTLKTPFFPLALYERDRWQARQLEETLGPHRRLSQEAIRFALSHPQIHSAIIGFAETWQLDSALAALDSNLPTLTWNDVLIRELDACPPG